MKKEKNSTNYSGNISIVTEIPVNGYTYYAEEIKDVLNGDKNFHGKMLYKKPTSTTLGTAKINSASHVQNRSESNNSIIDFSDLSRGILKNSEGMDNFALIH